MRHKPLLGAVVQVAFDPATLLVAGSDDPRPRGFDLVELAAQLDPQPRDLYRERAGIEHRGDHRSAFGEDGGGDDGAQGRAGMPDRPASTPISGIVGYRVPPQVDLKVAPGKKHVHVEVFGVEGLTEDVLDILGDGASGAEIFEERSHLMQGVRARSIEAAVDGSLDSTTKRPERRRDGERGAGSGPGRTAIDGGADRYDRARVRGGEKHGQHAVGHGAADDDVDVVEPVAQDRDAGADGQRGQRDSGERTHRGNHAPEQRDHRQDHRGARGGEHEPSKLQALDAGCATEALHERDDGDYDRPEEQWHPHGDQQACRCTVDGVGVPAADEEVADVGRERPSGQEQRDADEVGPRDGGPTTREEMPVGEQQERQHEHDAARDPAPQRDPLGGRSRRPPSRGGPQPPALCEIGGEGGEHSGDAEQHADAVAGVARDDQRASSGHGHRVDRVQHRVVGGLQPPRQHDRAHLQRHRHCKQHRRPPTQLQPPHESDCPNRRRGRQSCWRVAAMRVGA